MKRFRREGRNNPRYNLWQIEVTNRDDGNCLSCNSSEQVYIFPLINYDNEELLYDKDNGISLCTNCKHYIWSGDDYEWICRCLIMDRKFINAKKENVGKIDQKV